MDEYEQHDIIYRFRPKSADGPNTALKLAKCKT